MNMQAVFEYYSNPLVIEQLVSHAKDREVAGALFTGNYEKRPNIIQYPDDVIQMAKNGVTSFHLSVERWTYPMQLIKKDYHSLRKGWDLIIDMDSKLSIEESKITASLICDLLKKYSIRNHTIKFSGNRGFHICLPWEMFPDEVDYQQLSKRYPQAPRIIASFIKKEIASRLMKELIKKKGAKELIDLLGEKPEKMNPFYFVDVENNWGNRHMFRAPFSLNEKTWLVSLPFDPKHIDKFSKPDAKPDRALAFLEKEKHTFFRGEENEALALLTDAFDWHASIKKEPEKKKKKYIFTEKQVPESQFPPCMKIILAGLDDGKKRSIFTIINFLRMMNWPWKEIEERVFEWNNKNRPPLQTNLLIAGLRAAERNQLNPANCFNETFYTSFGVCKPDSNCKKIKNPIAYPLKKMDRPRFRGYECARCDKKFKSMRSLRVHIGRIHGGQ